MEKILVPLLVIAVYTSSVWCENSTRTAKLEILRSPTKVAVWKPDPYPILRTYGDELPAPTVRNQSSVLSNVTEDDATKSKYETTSEVTHNSTSLLNTTEVNNSTKEGLLDTSTTKNDTCVRRDYEEEIAAVFRDEAGPIESAMLVFNSTFQYMEGKISNVTELVNLRVLNETVVDCGEYLTPKLNETLETTTNTNSTT
ncbi:unnamed protein product [Nezara viridula]|uniref:Neuropeptide n=1 Tax=Nezara viridula TaxID=85310 RepID=A0A9P0E5B3_NEZVI|nr:unnamed protein product [Nezara viridula]